MFLSHANPEDNAFVLWLAPQLANDGYAVWSDVTKLLGGEDFWRDIEDTIRSRTAKFLFVLSQAAKAKENPRKELQVAVATAKAHNFKDFVIPLRVDDIPFADVNIQLSLTNAIDFSGGWSHGLKQLLGKLREDTVPTSPQFTPSAVAKWWESQYLADRCVVHRPEDYLTSWFPIVAMPPGIFFHRLCKPLERVSMPWPAVEHSGFLVTLAPRRDFGAALSGFMSQRGSRSFGTKELLNGEVGADLVSRRDASNLLVDLLRQAWEGTAQGLGLATHDLSYGRCYFFPRGLAEKDQVRFTRPDGKTIRRNVAGVRRRRRLDGTASTAYWHFGLEALPKLYPEPVFAMKSHVLFSDDGQSIWESNKRLLTARRSHCRMWWNSRWRDCLLAAMDWMADADGRVTLRTSKAAPLQIASTPLAFTSPVSYIEPGLADLISKARRDTPTDALDETDETAELVT